jgi:hypothetical protein
MNKINNYFFNETSGKYLHREFYFSRYPNHNRSYDVHHIDGNKENNSIDNLIAIPNKLHKEIHFLMSQGKTFTKREIEDIYIKSKCNGLKIEKIPTVINNNKKFIKKISGSKKRK